MLPDYGDSPVCTRGAPRASEKAPVRACTRTGLWKRPSDPQKSMFVRLSFFFFFLQLPFKEGSCSHEQLTSGKMLGTLRIRWFGLLRAPHSQLVSWGLGKPGALTSSAGDMSRE